MSLSPSLLSLCLPDAVSSFQTATDDYKDAPSPFARRAEDEDIDVSQRSGEGGGGVGLCLTGACRLTSEQTEPPVRAGQSCEDAGGQAPAAAPREGKSGGGGGGDTGRLERALR